MPFSQETRSLRVGKGAASSLCQFAVNLRKRLAGTVKSAREDLEVARLQQATQCGKGRRDVRFNVGDCKPILSMMGFKGMLLRWHTSGKGHT